MDPLSGVGLASSVLQFIDFGSKLVAGSIELYRSTDGATSGNRALEQLTRDLVGLCDRLTVTPASSNTLSLTQTEVALRDLAIDCKKLGAEFLVALNRLKTTGSRRSWSSLCQAITNMWKEKHIREYTRRLDMFRAAVTTGLIALLSQQQSVAQSSLNAISNKCNNLEHNLLDNSSYIRDAALSIRNQLQHGKYELSDLNRKLSTFLDDWTILRKWSKVIESLRFEQVNSRRSRVHDAHHETFEWILESSDQRIPEPMYFLDWLESGHGCFWISGKAGSGKSTLMKFICDHDKTQRALEVWAGQRKLIMASYFLWKPGTDLEKSQEGLMRTLLYDILRQCPALIPEVVTSTRLDPIGMVDPWTLKELQLTFSRLTQQTQSSTKFCLFIDGIDEYDGEPQDIINAVNSLSSSTYVKVCVSSRPWNAFKKAYGKNAQQMIELQYLNRADIKKFVNDHFEASEDFQKIRQTASSYERLIEDIVEKAQGVFLWVFLVVRSLLRGLENGDSILTLRRRLREIPEDLNAYFMNILNSTEKVYRSEAAMMLRIRLATWEFCPLLRFACLEENDNFAEVPCTKVWTISDIRKIEQTTARRINARCKDLLEIIPIDVSVNVYVDFTHRTVKDFLETPEAQNILKSQVPARFSADQYICKYMLYELKRLPSFILKRVHLLYTLCDFLGHCRTLERERGLLPIALINEMDRTLKSRWDDLNTSPLICNISMPEGAPHSTSYIVHLAIALGLIKFVEERVDLGFDVNGEKGEINHSPLHAVFDQNFHWTFRNYEPRQDMVKLLLEKGADPNRQVNGSSPWEYFLRDLRNIFRSGDADDGASLLRLLLHHGASPTQQINIAEMAEYPIMMTPAEIFETQFGPPLSTRLIEILAEREAEINASAAIVRS